MPSLIEHRVSRDERSSAGKERRKQHKRVLLADDNPAILQVVRELLQTQYEIVGAVTDGESALREAAELKPDILVLDISMNDLDGLAVARQLRDTLHQTKIVFLTVHELAEFVRVALAAGGTGYVFKSRLDRDLIPALQAASCGRLFVSCQSA